MALPAYCPRCQATKQHNSRGQCLSCLQDNQKQEFKAWKSDKSIDEQLEGLYIMIKENQRELLTYL